jgi:hypothetical protein
MAAALVILWWSLRRLWQARPTRAGPVDVVEISVAVAVLALFAHSAVDFDWSHPAILVEVALLAAAVGPTGQPNRSRGRAATALIALVATLGVLLPALHQWQQSQPDIRNSNDHELDKASATFGNYRSAWLVLSYYAHADRPLSTAEAARALDLTAGVASVDLHLALLRDAVGASKGLYPDAVARARASLRPIGGALPPYVPDFALVLSSAGETEAAREVLSRDIAVQVARGRAAPNLRIELLQWAQTLGRGSGYACLLNEVRPILKSRYTSDLPPTTASCPRHDQGSG